MTDREDREEHIKRLEAALACEEKQFSGKCSKQTCDDNCALLYEQGNWGEWKETLRYAINSLKIDLKYDLLYEETSGQADKPTTKNDLAVDAISRADAIKAMQDKAKKLTNEDTINGLCGAVAILFDLPSVTPQEPKFIVKSDGTIEQIKNCNGCVFRKEWEKIGKLLSVVLEKQTEQEPKTGHWIEEFNDLEGEVRFTCSSCGKFQLFGTDFCPNCGADMREVVEK